MEQQVRPTSVVTLHVALLDWHHVPPGRHRGHRRVNRVERAQVCVPLLQHTCLPLMSLGSHLRRRRFVANCGKQLGKRRRLAVHLALYQRAAPRTRNGRFLGVVARNVVEALGTPLIDREHHLLVARRRPGCELLELHQVPRENLLEQGSVARLVKVALERGGVPVVVFDEGLLGSRGRSGWHPTRVKTRLHPPARSIQHC